MNLKRTVRVLVVDDSPVALAAICARLETERNIEIVGIAKSGFELPAMAEELQPDVIVTDLHMPRMNGLECTLSLRAMMPSTRFIIITDMLGSLEGASQPIEPNHLYFDKNTTPEEVLAEIRSLFPKVLGNAASDAPTQRRIDKCEAGYC